jgi:hypothetical protein
LKTVEKGKEKKCLIKSNKGGDLIKV